MRKIYLAGPDVFLPDARAVGRKKRKMCAQAGFEGLFPLEDDGAVATDPTEIFLANRARMDEADLGLFNLTPFRGPSADAGTAFEVGYMFAQGKRIWGYSNSEVPYARRAATLAGSLAREDGVLVDRDGSLIEAFELADNLMIARAIDLSHGHFVAIEEPATLAAWKAFRRVLDLLGTDAA